MMNTHSLLVRNFTAPRNRKQRADAGAFSWQKTHWMMDNRIIYALASNEESYRFNTGMLSVSAQLPRAGSPTDLALLVTESRRPCDHRIQR